MGRKDGGGRDEIPISFYRGTGTLLDNTARIIAHNVLESFWEQLHHRPQVGKLLEELPQPLMHNIMETALKSCQDNLEVTPKEIDDLIQNCTAILANAITQTLHPDMNQDFADSTF